MLAKREKKGKIFLRIESVQPRILCGSLIEIGQVIIETKILEFSQCIFTI